MPHTEIYLGGFAFNCVKLQAAIKLKESEQELKHGKLNPYLISRNSSKNSKGLVFGG